MDHLIQIKIMATAMIAKMEEAEVAKQIQLLDTSKESAVQVQRRSSVQIEECESHSLTVPPPSSFVSGRRSQSTTRSPSKQSSSTSTSTSLSTLSPPSPPVVNESSRMTSSVSEKVKTSSQVEDRLEQQKQDRKTPSREIRKQRSVTFEKPYYESPAESLLSRLINAQLKSSMEALNKTNGAPEIPTVTSRPYQLSTSYSTSSLATLRCQPTTTSIADNSSTISSSSSPRQLRPYGKRQHRSSCQMIP